MALPSTTVAGARPLTRARGRQCDGEFAAQVIGGGFAKLADLAVVDGHLIEAPADSRNVRIVFKDGIGYHSAGLIELVEGTVGVR